MFRLLSITLLSLFFGGIVGPAFAQVDPAEAQRRLEAASKEARSPEALMKENERLRKENATLKRQIAELSKRLARLEGDLDADGDVPTRAVPTGKVLDGIDAIYELIPEEVFGYDNPARGEPYSLAKWNEWLAENIAGKSVRFECEVLDIRKVAAGSAVGWEMKRDPGGVRDTYRPTAKNQVMAEERDVGDFLLYCQGGPAKQAPHYLRGQPGVALFCLFDENRAQSVATVDRYAKVSVVGRIRVIRRPIVDNGVYQDHMIVLEDCRLIERAKD